MAISAKDVMELRKQTDCGMMECKKALTEADGNFEKAIEILRERGLATAAKKASRTAAEGMVYADYCPQCKVGVVIEVNAETDFVAKNDKFVAFVKEATQVIMKQNPADVEALMACKTENGETVDEALKNLILVIKENIKVRRFVRYEGVCSAYVHGGGTHGILVNFEKAIEILRERGLATAAKKASRVAAEGMVYADYCPACKVGVVIEVNAETDFVAKNDKFVDFVKEATKVIMKQNPADVEALMACKTEAGETVDEALKNLILVIKENIKVRRFTRYEGVCSAYVHGGGTHGILVNFETTNDIDAKDEFVAYGKDIAMQVAAANPGYVDEASVPAEVVAKEKEIMLAQMAGDPKTANKPEAVKQKMIEGKIKKFFKENCLVDQEFVKDSDLTVAQYTAKVAKDLGGDIKIVKFTRFQKGEGLEKRADDFAAEVASMVK